MSVDPSKHRAVPIQHRGPRCADIIEQRRNDVSNLYSEIRDQMSPTSDIRRKIDACDAITRDIVRIILERVSGVDEDFDAEREITRLRGLLEHDYAQSIYGSTAASNRSQRSSAHSQTSRRSGRASCKRG